LQWIAEAGCFERLPGRTGRLAAEFPARLLGRAVGLPLVAGHASQTRFSHLDTPPCEHGTTWAVVSSSRPGWLPISRIHSHALLWAFTLLLCYNVT